MNQLKLPLTQRGAVNFQPSLHVRLLQSRLISAVIVLKRSRRFSTLSCMNCSYVELDCFVAASTVTLVATRHVNTKMQIARALGDI